MVLYVGSRSETLLRRWAWVGKKGDEDLLRLNGWLKKWRKR